MECRENNVRVFVSSVEYFKKKQPKAERILNIEEFIPTAQNHYLFGETGPKKYYYNNTNVNKEVLEELVRGRHIVYFVSENIDKRSALYKMAKKCGNVYYEPKVNAALLKRRYPNLSSAAINEILTHCDNYSKLNTAYQVLDSFEEITDDKVFWVFSSDYNDRIFDVLDRAFNPTKTFNTLYSEYVNNGESKFKLMYLLYNRLKELIIIKSYQTLSPKQIADKTGVNYYTAKNNLQTAARQDIHNLRRWFLECGKIERDIKYGLADVELDFERLFFEIVSTNKRS